MQGVCTCHPGWSGAKCSSNLCSSVYCGPAGHGSCRGGKCVCSPGFKGDQCQFVDRCEVPIPIVSQGVSHNLSLDISGVVTVLCVQSCPEHQWCSNGKCLCVEGYAKVFGVCTRQSTSKPIAVSPKKPSKCPVNPAGSLAGHAYPSGTCDDAGVCYSELGLPVCVTFFGIFTHCSISIASVILINIPAPSVCRKLCLRSLSFFFCIRQSRWPEEEAWTSTVTP